MYLNIDTSIFAFNFLNIALLTFKVLSNPQSELAYTVTKKPTVSSQRVSHAVPNTQKNPTCPISSQMAACIEPIGFGLSRITKLAYATWHTRKCTHGKFDSTDQ